MEGFYGKEVGARSYWQKKRKDCFRQGHLPLGRWAGGLITEIILSSFVGKERDPVTDYLIGADQKIPDLTYISVKTVFLGEAETAIRLGIKPRFGDLA